ncbi:MAG: vWA domain-containing protein, partial [Planctomycetota bacterium]
MRRAGVLLLLCAAAVARDDPFKKAKAVWDAKIDRPPLATRLKGMRALARTRDPRAMRLMAARYARPHLPKDHERYLLARLCGEYLTQPLHVEGLRAWMGRHRKDEDGWLWFNALRAEAKGTDVSRVVDLVRGKGNVFLRAAALEALAHAGRDEALAVIPGLPTHPVLARSCAAALRRRREALGTPAFRAAAVPVIALLEGKAVDPHTQLVIARQLARVFDVETVSPDPLYWRQLLGYQEVKDRKGTTRAGRPRFFGIEGTGERVVYLIDMSDSMTATLSALEQAAVRAMLPGLDLDWKKTRSRFDLARACLKRSLWGLLPQANYMIVGFGKKAEVFRSTKGLVRATRSNVAASVRELDAIRPGPRPPDRPYGTLWGATNLHGALLRAFQVRGRKLVKRREHVTGFRDGTDTIFVLSDGQPTTDDFAAKDLFKGGRVTTDTETGAQGHRGAGTINYGGPYRHRNNLLGDLARLNLFRKVEVHCIAMGEASSVLLPRMAGLGLGRYRSLGRLARGGYVDAWWVIGPFDAPHEKSWADAEFPEQGID